MIGCGNEPKPGIASPDGSVIARAVEMEQRGRVETSQVLLEFPAGHCVAGSISHPGADPGFELRWLDARTLLVTAPKDVELHPAPAASALDHTIQCFDQRVHVVVRRR